MVPSDLASGPARPGFPAPFRPWGEEEVQVSVQGPLTVLILGLGSQRWRRNEIMLFLISSAKKIFHLLPVRDARFSNKRTAVSLTSSCSCGDRCVLWVSPPRRPFPAGIPTPPALSHFRKGRLEPWRTFGIAPGCPKDAFRFPAALYPHGMNLELETWFLTLRS